MEKNINVSEYYANYLADCISDMKFINKDNLKEYLKTHLNLFFNECLKDNLLPDLERRKDSLVQENQKLSLERLEIERQILIAKSALKEKIYVDTKWLANANYAFRIKANQIQNNLKEISKINSLITNRNIEKSNTEERTKINYIRDELKKRFGEVYFMEFIKVVENRLLEEFKNI